MFETVALPVHVIEHSLEHAEQLSQNRQKDSAAPSPRMEGVCEFCLALHSSSSLQPIRYELVSPRFETRKTPFLPPIRVQKVDLLLPLARGPPTI